jgi:hypothetical protein
MIAKYFYYLWLLKIFTVKKFKLLANVGGKRAVKVERTGNGKCFSTHFAFCCRDFVLLKKGSFPLEFPPFS